MPKITKQNVGGVGYTMVGCAITGVCNTEAATYIKTVVLSDSDIVADGMIIACTFAEGNSAGNAPTPQTVYSSDQITYYSDAGLTTPVTLPPDGCYDIEYTGSGNIYTLLTYPVISVAGETGPVCTSKGEIAGGALWSAGDIVIFLYTGGKFLGLNL